MRDERAVLVVREQPLQEQDRLWRQREQEGVVLHGVDHDQFTGCGISVEDNTDDPIHVWITIRRDYAIAAIDFSPAELLRPTRNVVRTSFASARRRKALLAELQALESL